MVISYISITTIYYLIPNQFIQIHDDNKPIVIHIHNPKTPQINQEIVQIITNVFITYSFK